VPSKGNYQNDDCLVELLATDLDQHFKELVFIYESRLEVYAFDVIGHWQDAEDVVQDALLRVYLALKGYSAVRIRTLKLRAWLYTIVKNACYNYMRRQKPPVLLSLSTSEEGDQFPEIEVDCSELPETVVEAMERIHEIEQAVQALPKYCREMVRLRLLEGFSYKEIADLLKRPLGTVKHHIHCGITILAKNLRGQGGTK
jgi:RNA polymerase sigma-70 factor (ECF subfamily)